MEFFSDLMEQKEGPDLDTGPLPQAAPSAWDMDLGAELERMAIFESAKNAGVTPGQMNNFLGSASAQAEGKPELLVTPASLDGFKQGLDARLVSDMTAANDALDWRSRVNKGAPGKLASEGNLLDSSILADVADQGASPTELVEVLKGGQMMVPGRELHEQWASMPQSDSRRSSHHTQSGASTYVSGRGVAGTPEYQLDSRRHTGTSAPFVHHLLSGVVTDKQDEADEVEEDTEEKERDLPLASFGEKTFFQLENTAWTEKADPEVGASQTEKPSKKEQAGHAFDAVQYFATGKSQNVGPYGYSRHTDPRAVQLPGPDAASAEIINANEHYAD